MTKPTVTRTFFIPRPESFRKFIISPSLWVIPDFKNLASLMQRIKNNLLFFQTNYLILNLVCFCFFMLLSMRTLLTGFLSGLFIVVAVLFFLEHIPQARQIKQNHPTLVILGGVALIIVTWNALRTLLVIAGAAMAPVPLWILHAMFRSSDGLIDGSNLGGKYLETPIGQIMHMVGVDPTASS